jgi:hypothetical protein
VDGDGDTDILSASADDNTIAWLENDGSQNFTVHTITASAKNAKDVYAADIDGDGDTDVLSASKNDNTVAWYENDGSADPNFTVRTITTSAGGANGVYAADVDGDGDTDILSSAAIDSEIAWYENDGSSDPSFTPRTITISAASARDVHAADVDGDGDVDVLSAANNSDTVEWYENDGAADPGFTTRVIPNGIDDAQSIYTADVDGDNDTDILTASGGDDRIDWYENDGNADPIFTSRNIATGPNFPESVYVADVDGDNDTDVLSASEFDNTINWYENDGSTDPGFTTREITSSALGAQSVYAADVDGDNNIDVLSASDEDNKVAWYENDGATDPSFTTRRFTPPSTADGAESVSAADVDGDDDTDILSASSNDDKVVWYENDGSTPPSFTPRTVTASGGGPQSVVGADIDGDGDTDLLSASLSDDRIYWYENDGATNPSFTTRTVATSVSSAQSVYVADIDGDGDTDVLSASSGDSEIDWYENDGNADPSFTPRNITGSATTAQSVYAADVDGDGDTDVLSASQDDNTIAWYENDGAPNPSFTVRNITTGASTAQSVYAADVDGDGDTDVLSASSGDGEIDWYENDGNADPSFTPRNITTEALGAQSVYATDLNGDNNIDILSASSGDNKIAWYENNGGADPSFTLQTITTQAIGAQAVYAADVDGDPTPDVLSASTTDDKIAWYRNTIETTSTRPDITLSNPDNLPAPGESASLSITFPDDFTPTSATLVYAPAATGDIQSIGLDLASLSASQRTLSVQIPGEVVTERGVQYFLATEGESVSSFTVPSTAPTNTAHLPVRLSDVQADGAFEPNTYRMLTVPVGFRNRSAFEALEDRFGSYNATRWRLARWAGSNGAYQFGPNVAPLEPGEAAWVITSDGRVLAFEEALSPEVTGPVPITLQSGWNQIGSPFRFPVAWADVQKPASVRTPVAYDPSKPQGDRFQFGASTLEPWDGVFVYNEANEAVTIRVPPKDASLSEPATASALADTKGAPSGYRLQAIATLSRNGLRLQDHKTWLGFSGTAQKGFGPKDRAKPPAVGPHVRLYAMPESGPGLAKSLRPKPADGAAWDLQLHLNLDENRQSTETVTVQLAEQGPRPDGFRRYVIDRNRNKRLPITNRSVQVPVQPDESTRRLRVVVGTEAFAKQHSDGAALAVSETKLLPNAPNPFAESTTLSYQLAEKQPVTIAIYDLLGRRVTTLVDGPRPSGVHQIEWQAGTGSTSLSSGVYICRMQAGSYSGSQKLVLVR